ncbi:hypothetical protein BDR04DRAFT_217918 [Suillus decipiens]|nr:hypothetical protein BDR04DRAFT_217918 [Suillus decipiens]
MVPSRCVGPLQLGIKPWLLLVQSRLTVSVNCGSFPSFSATEGVNVIPFGDLFCAPDAVVRVNLVGWQDNHVNLESIELKVCGSSLPPYEQSHIAFGCIGDSLSADVSRISRLPQKRANTSRWVSTKPGRSLYSMTSEVNITLELNLELLSQVSSRTVISME